MQASISYHTINGKIRSATYEPYTRSEALLTDALGSVVRTQDDYGGANFRYYAYGALMKTTPGYLTPYIGWVGSLGYRETNLNHAEQYIRARHYSTTEARWTTVDPIWPHSLPYNYGESGPTSAIDETGLWSRTGTVTCFPIWNKAIKTKLCKKKTTDVAWSNAPHNETQGTFCNNDPENYSCPTFAYDSLSASWPNVKYYENYRITQCCNGRSQESHCHHRRILAPRSDLPIVSCGDLLTVSYKGRSMRVRIIDQGPANWTNNILDLGPLAAEHFARYTGLRWSTCNNFEVKNVTVSG